MAMLDVLARLARPLGIAIEAAAIDHGLRAEAGGEIALARAHAEELGIPLHVERVELAGKGSIQARARAARYAALRAIAERIGARRIAVGHTQDDQAETVLARMLRGSGPRGLAGIAPRRADGVIRPLIDATRAETRSWCEAHGIAFADDPSNADPRFQRARIRHQLMPALTGESPAIAAHLAAIADDARALSAMARRAAARLVRQAGPDWIDAERLARAPEPVRREALRAWGEGLTGRTIRRAHLDALERALQGRGEARLPSGWVARRVENRLLAHPLHDLHGAGSVVPDEEA